jgi:hypothetical protein
MLEGQVLFYVRNISSRSLSKTGKPLLVQPVCEQMFERGFSEFEAETPVFRRRLKCAVSELYSEDAGFDSQMVGAQAILIEDSIGFPQSLLKLCDCL